jgi:hypothetical protein
MTLSKNILVSSSHTWQLFTSRGADLFPATRLQPTDCGNKYTTQQEASRPSGYSARGLDQHDETFGNLYDDAMCGIGKANRRCAVLALCGLGLGPAQSRPCAVSALCSLGPVQSRPCAVSALRSLGPAQSWQKQKSARGSNTEMYLPVPAAPRALTRTVLPTWW